MFGERQREGGYHVADDSDADAAAAGASGRVHGPAGGPGRRGGGAGRTGVRGGARGYGCSGDGCII